MFRVCKIESVDGANISAYYVHECEAINRTGLRSRRFIFTGHVNGTVQVSYGKSGKPRGVVRLVGRVVRLVVLSHMTSTHPLSFQLLLKFEIAQLHYSLLACTPPYHGA